MGLNEAYTMFSTSPFAEWLLQKNLSDWGAEWGILNKNDDPISALRPNSISGYDEDGSFNVCVIPINWLSTRKRAHMGGCHNQTSNLSSCTQKPSFNQPVTKSLFSRHTVLFEIFQGWYKARCHVVYRDLRRHYCPILTDEIYKDVGVCRNDCSLCNGPVSNVGLRVVRRGNDETSGTCCPWE